MSIASDKDLRAKELKEEIHEWQVEAGKHRKQLRYNMGRIKTLRGTLDVALDKCEGSIQSIGYIGDDEMDFLKNTNRDLVEVSLNRDNNVNKIGRAERAIAVDKRDLKEVENVK